MRTQTALSLQTRLPHYSPTDEKAIFYTMKILLPGTDAYPCCVLPINSLEMEESYASFNRDFEKS